MTEAEAADYLRLLMQNAFAAGLPILLTAVGVGLIISLLQSVTSLQDQSLTFVPKLIAVGFVMVASAPYVIKKLSDFAILMIQSMVNMAPP
jgi:flagellar biosynthetic protein FliQ